MGGMFQRADVQVIKAAYGCRWLRCLGMQQTLRSLTQGRANVTPCSFMSYEPFPRASRKNSSRKRSKDA